MIMADSRASMSSGLSCPCGAGICSLLTSKTQKNPGRLFYRCPSDGCGFFKWLDQVESHELTHIPNCACGAGICRTESRASGPNAGRKFFVCPIKKGQGACNYFMWQDDAQANSSFSPSTLSFCTGTGPSNNNQVERDESANLVNEIESVIAETSQISRSFVPTSSLLKKDKILEELKRSEEILDDPLRKRYKRARDADFKSNGIVFWSSSKCRTMPPHSLTEQPAQASSPPTKMEINEKMTEVLNQSLCRETVSSATSSYPSSSSYSSTLPMKSGVSLESCLMVVKFHQDIACLQLYGWLGRLVFRPQRCLMEPAQKPLFCCVFPSFDPIPVTKKVNICDSQVPVYSLASPFSCLSISQPLSTANQCPQKSNYSMIESVSKAFAKAAEQLQNDLLTLLKSMDVQDHETMSKEADATFVALDLLQIDYKEFSVQVKAFIWYASLLAKIDQSMSHDPSSQLLLDRFNREKMRLREINDAYAKSIEAFPASKLGSMVLSTELSQIEAENLAMKARVEQIREDEKKAWESFQNASKELEDAYKLCESREAERRAAKAAYERAKIVLWG